MKILSTIWLACFILLLGACNDKAETKDEHTEETEAHEEGNSVSLTKVQMQTAGIEIGAIDMKNLTSSISVNGTLAVPNQNKALITSLAGGILRSLKIQPGDFVRKGQVIGTIANAELSTIQQQMISIQSQLTLAEQEEKRQKELVAGGAAPLKNLQKAEAELNSLRAQKSALKQQLATLGVVATGDFSSTLSIVAPISGTISEITAQIGSKIDASTPIAQIINNSELHLDLFVYEKDLPKVQPGQTIHFTLTNNPGKEYDATIYSIGTAFANESKSIPIHAKVVNDKQGLIEGMSVTARISLGESVYPAVPDDAIVNNGGKDYIFILSADSASKNDEIHFERVQIIKGASDVGYTEIKSIETIAKDAKIAVKGSFFLMAKMTNSGEHD